MSPLTQRRSQRAPTSTRLRKFAYCQQISPASFRLIPTREHGLQNDQVNEMGRETDHSSAELRNMTRSWPLATGARVSATRNRASLELTKLCKWPATEITDWVGRRITQRKCAADLHILKRPYPFWSYVTTPGGRHAGDLDLTSTLQERKSRENKKIFIFQRRIFTFRAFPHLHFHTETDSNATQSIRR